MVHLLLLQGRSMDATRGSAQSSPSATVHPLVVESSPRKHLRSRERGQITGVRSKALTLYAKARTVAEVPSRFTTVYDPMHLDLIQSLRRRTWPRTAGAVLAVLTSTALGCGRVDAERSAPIRAEVASRTDAFATRQAVLIPSSVEPEDTLKIRRQFGDSLSFAQVVKLYHLPGKLLVMDRLLNYHLSTVDLSDGSLQHFGRDGDGPREFREPYSASFHGDLEEVWVYDFRTNRFTLLDLSGPEPVFRRTLPAPSGVRLLDPVLSTSLVSNALSGAGTLVIGQPDRQTGHRLIDLGLPFDSAAHPAYVARRLLNRTFMSPSPDHGRFAVVHQFANRIDIVSRDGIHLVTGSGPRQANPSYRMQRDRFFWNDDNISLYTGVAASERHVYVLYCGCRFAEEQAMRRVHIFDWEGRFVREIAFDRNVFALAVAPDDSMLFGFVEEPHPQIVEWEIPLAIRTGTEE